MTVFDPASIEPYTVIKFPYDFGGNFGGRTKLFVVVGHKEDTYFVSKRQVRSICT